MPMSLAIRVGWLKNNGKMEFLALLDLPLSGDARAAFFLQGPCRSRALADVAMIAVRL